MDEIASAPEGGVPEKATRLLDSVEAEVIRRLARPCRIRERLTLLNLALKCVAARDAQARTAIYFELLQSRTPSLRRPRCITEETIREAERAIALDPEINPPHPLGRGEKTGDA